MKVCYLCCRHCTSHVNLAPILLRRENNIILICLPAHSSHILQPLDRDVYYHYKKMWKAVLTKYYKDTKCKNLDKENFLPLLKQVHQSGKCFTGLHAIGGFQYSGLFPVNKKRVNQHRLAISDTFHQTTPLTPLATVQMKVFFQEKNLIKKI